MENLKPNFEPGPWQVFREEQLWTREVNLVFHDNEEPLRRLYQMYAKQQGGKVPLQNALRLLESDCSIRMHKYDAVYCYAMSLSTCVDLFKAMHNKIMHMTYEEFLEMIGRASDLHF